MHTLYGSVAVGSKQQNWLKQNRRFMLGMSQDLKGRKHQGFIEAWKQESATLSTSSWGHLLSVLAPLLRHHLSFMQMTCSVLSLNTYWPRTPEVTLPGVLPPATMKTSTSQSQFQISWREHAIAPLGSGTQRPEPLHCVQLCQTHDLWAESGRSWTSGVPINCDHQVKNCRPEKSECW